MVGLTSILDGPGGCWSRRLRTGRLVDRVGSHLAKEVRMSSLGVVGRSPEALRHTEVAVDILADRILDGGLVAGNLGRSSVGTGCMGLTYWLTKS